MLKDERAKELADQIWKCADGAPGTTYADVWKRRSFEILKDWLTQVQAEARLEEAKWWADKHLLTHSTYRALEFSDIEQARERIAALEASTQGGIRDKR